VKGDYIMAKILIVDDDEDFVYSVETVLKKDGYEIEIQNTAKNVPEVIKKVKPDLLILDVMFPENQSAGFNVARAIRNSSGEHKEIPILLLTAVNQKFPVGFSEKDIDAEWMPVTDFLEKPVDFDLLRKKVSDLVNKLS
jgi:CheY-like chemotaxis protein